VFYYLLVGRVPGQTEECDDESDDQTERGTTVRLHGAAASVVLRQLPGQGAAAAAWQQAQYAEQVRQTYGTQLARLAQGHNRTVLELDTQDALLAHALVAAAEAAQLPVLASPVEKGRAKRSAWIRVTVRAAEWDIEVSGVGDSVVLFAGHSAQGIDWLGEHLHVESWQRLGSSIGVEHRYASAIVHGAAEAGLRVRVQ
jgi:hypothetical protein